MNRAIRLSIIVPVYNECDNLQKLGEAIRAAMEKISPSFWEVICVNDGSTDGSTAILERMAKADPHFIPLHFRENQGQTAAFDAGIRAAKGELLVTMDADLQNDPADISLLLDRLEDGIGVVCGVRVKRNDTWLRRASSRFANAVRNWISKDNVTDTGCSLKLFRAECFANIKLFEGLHRFLPTLVKMEGYRAVEVPVSHHPRYAGESKYGVWNRVFKSFKDLLAVRWMKSRLLHYEILASEEAEMRVGHSDTRSAIPADEELSALQN